MIDFDSPNDVIVGLVNSPSLGCNRDIYKPSITAASGFDYSGWTAGGVPSAGVAPTTWATPTNLTAGALVPELNIPVTTTGRLLLFSMVYSVANQQVYIRDRVGHMGGLSGTSIAAQTVGASLATPAASFRCNASGEGVEWYLEWYTATGSTGVNATCNVTYSDGSTGNIVVALPASVPANRLYAIRPATNLFIKAVNTVTLSATTGTVGNFGVTAFTRLTQAAYHVAYAMITQEWATVGMPRVGTGACLTYTVGATSTGTGILQAKIVVGVK